MRPVVTALLALLLPLVAFGQSTDIRALIVIGLAPNEAQASRLRDQAGSIRTGLIARGVAADSIQILAAGNGGPLRREGILDAIAATPASTKETWLVLLGTVAPNREGEPSLQISGPRLGANEFAAAVAKLPGTKRVLVGASAGGGFLPPLLQLPDVEAVSAAAPSGEINEPRFPGFWAETLIARPHASFLELAAFATERVGAYYQENQLAQGEHAHRLDREHNRIVAVETGTAPATAPTPDNRPAEAVAASDIVIPRPTGGVDIERQPATDATRALVEAARREAAALTDAALVLALQAEITVARDQSVTERWTSRTFVRTAEALDDVATFDLPHNPPQVLARLEAARVIRPDGAQLLVNPRPLEATAASRREDNLRARAATAPTAIELPEVTAGCVVEVAWSVERKSTHEIPELHQEWRFAGKFPVRSLQVNLHLPDAEGWRFFSHGLPEDGPVTTDNGLRTVAWHLADLPAADAPAGSPPWREMTPWIGVSSLASWDKFAAWYRQLATGAEETGTEVEALAARLASAHAGRMERMRAAYEAVAALRYVAIELGVGAFRPRTPEQVWRQRYGDCKDKAGLLAALLRRLGIAAEFALINRFDTTFRDFPGWQFNHAIVRVPAAPADGQATDLWLDSTDRLVPFGVIAPGDARRPALAFPAGNGPAEFHEVGTAQEPPALWHEIWQLSPDDAGHGARGKVTLAATGFAEATLRRMFTDLTPARRLARLHELLGVDLLTLTNLTTTDAYDLATPFRVEATVESVAPRKIAPRPPQFALLFGPATRTAALAYAEGRPSRYVQEVNHPEAAAARETEAAAAGFQFRMFRQPGAVVREITTPAGSLAAADYPAVRAAWQRFLQASTP
ncbi:MAG TPA: DUF3857 domain-containing protein [Lacunisphaera sp.]|nr:DUF3857 domain-containing protein [Lacunisphaera sp.]